MKISKLFHWLYAILMLLPFLVFLPNAFYYGFNEHAVAQEKTEQVPVYYDSNNVTNVNDLVIGNAYIYIDNFTYFNDSGSQIRLLELKIIDDELINTLNDYDNTKQSYIYINNNQSTPYLFYYDTSNNTYAINISSRIFNFQLVNTTTNSNIIVDHIKKTEFVKEYLTLTTNMSITDSMSYAWDSVWQNDLFSWSYGSFLTEPFIYIGNLFNVPVDNSLFYALSYWLDISIIWLTFDLLMYVPLLVHRWIDKGIVE